MSGRHLRGRAISQGREIEGDNSGSAASLLFAAGRRPTVGAVRELADKQGGFSVSFDPSLEGAAGEPSPGDTGASWLELLINGLTFELAGLAPGAPADPAPCVHAYGLAANASAVGLDAVTLRPGVHLAGGHRMFPVLRALAALTARLAVLDGVEAVAWHSARTWSGPAYFRESVLRWVDGGVFPALGLTALVAMPDGGMQSEGLSLFATQELRIEPELMADQPAGAKIGLRLIDYLAEAGPIAKEQRLIGPDGQPLRLEPSANGRFVRVWRG